jgi:non-heme chloroperoxidase
MERAAMRHWLLILAVLLGCSDVERQRGLDFGALPPADRDARATQSYIARDGVSLPLRIYDSAAPANLILLHGSSAHGLYLSRLAVAIADAGVANVYTPDLRGHGAAPLRRGDIDYVDQLEDDLVDLMA